MWLQYINNTSSLFTDSVVLDRQNETIEDIANRYRRSDFEWDYCVRRGADLNVPDGRDYDQVMAAFSPATVCEQLAGNPCVRRTWRRALSQELGDQFNFATSDPSARVRTRFWFVTILEKDWNTSERNFAFDLEGASRKVRNALAGLNYVAAFEFGTFTNLCVNDDEGRSRTISPHVHGIVWGQNKRKIEDHMRKRRCRFSGGVVEGKSIQFKELKTREDIARVVHYMAKAPLIGYRVRPTKDGKFTANKTRLPYVSHLRNFEILNSYSMDELLISSREGASIVRQIRQDQKRRLPPSPAVRAGSHSCYTGPSLRLG